MALTFTITPYATWIQPLQVYNYASGTPDDPEAVYCRFARSYTTNIDFLLLESGSGLTWTNGSGGTPVTVTLTLTRAQTALFNTIDTYVAALWFKYSGDVYTPVDANIPITVDDSAIRDES